MREAERPLLSSSLLGLLRFRNITAPRSSQNATMVLPGSGEKAHPLMAADLYDMFCRTSDSVNDSGLIILSEPVNATAAASFLRGLAVRRNETSSEPVMSLLWVLHSERCAATTGTHLASESPLASRAPQALNSRRLARAHLSAASPPTVLEMRSEVVSWSCPHLFDLASPGAVLRQAE